MPSDTLDPKRFKKYSEEAEKVFMEETMPYLESIGFKFLRKATPEEDMCDGIDYWITKSGVPVSIQAKHRNKHAFAPEMNFERSGPNTRDCFDTKADWFVFSIWKGKYEHYMVPTSFIKHATPDMFVKKRCNNGQIVWFLKT